jgi:hypothetical protein
MGIVALVNPFKTTETFMFATGIFITIAAVVKLISLLILYRGSKGLDKVIKKEKADKNAVDVTEASVVVDADKKEDKKDDKEDSKEEIVFTNEV